MRLLGGLSSDKGRYNSREIVLVLRNAASLLQPGVKFEGTFVLRGCRPHGKSKYSHVPDIFA
jgi:hypothetical protein